MKRIPEALFEPDFDRYIAGQNIKKSKPFTEEEILKFYARPKPSIPFDFRKKRTRTREDEIKEYFASVKETAKSVAAIKAKAMFQSPFGDESKLAMGAKQNKIK